MAQEKEKKEQLQPPQHQDRRPGLESEMTPKPEVAKLMQHSATASLPMDAKQCDVAALRYILEAYRFGFAYSIDFYAPGGEDVFFKLRSQQR